MGLDGGQGRGWQLPATIAVDAFHRPRGRGGHDDRSVGALPASAAVAGNRSRCSGEPTRIRLPMISRDIGRDTPEIRNNPCNAICQNVEWHYLNRRNYLINFLFVKQNIRASKGI
ncbi:hypothetical protein [Burkholderia puraquae]|uniref:hypothetical protein n=1 Tax=Burkholderia puraquae TaxID=1904757 RepID=UPI001056408B|nr:hypothetical protein [Burkholderia puraquae]